MSANCCVAPTDIEAEVGVTLTPVTYIIDGLTIMLHAAVLFPSCVLTVIVAEPSETAVTSPLVLTVAIEVFEELQLTV